VANESDRRPLRECSAGGRSHSDTRVGCIVSSTTLSSSAVRVGQCADCGQPDLSLCEACEYRRYLAATGGRDYANEQRTRRGLPPTPRPELR
jgi:hypothetical protein